MNKFLDLAKRAVAALERIAQRLDLLTLAQANYITQSIDIADIGLNPNSAAPRQQFNVTMNAATPLAVQLHVRDDGKSRYLDIFLFDDYGSIAYAAHLRAKTVSELRDQFPNIPYVSAKELRR